jgi:ubiquinone/menaquinone biosynthesis C-methylase UbiE
MKKDAYKIIAKVYDRLFDNMNKGLKLIGIRMFRPTKGMSILDVGCGTGTHLELYCRYQCNLVGLDSSPSMLIVARERLKDSASLNLGDAAYMPYDDNRFDLVITMLMLHELSGQIRLQVLEEILRVLKKDGSALLIDFHPGPYQMFQGLISKGIINLAEFAAGREHFKYYRNFINAEGLPGLLNIYHIPIQKHQVVAGGTFGVYLVGKPIDPAFSS